LPASEVTIGGLLGRAGYETLALGKTHYYRPLLREFDRCVDLVEHGAWLESRSPVPVPPGVEILGPWWPFSEPASVWLNAACLPYAPDEDMPDTFFAETARRYLGQEHSWPFFLWVGFYVTHAPFRFPVEFRSRFDPRALAPPPLGPEDADRIPPVFRDLTDEQKRGIAAAYYTSSSYLDRNVGRILDALERSGHADDTLVVFNSDHGYLLGHHGRFEKHCGYEEAIRSALILRLPGLIAPGSATGALLELIDVVPTILRLCGIEVPANVQDRSLVRLLRGETDRHRDHVAAEYADNAEATVRTDPWKLIYSAGNRRRRDGYDLGPSPPGRSICLYDLAEDPGEMIDVSGRAKHAAVVEDLLALLADHVRRTARDPDAIPETGDVHALLATCLTPLESVR
jgi:choline-sulfatase